MAKASCYTCVYAYLDMCQVMQGSSGGFPCRPACANHPDSLGRMRPAPAGGVCRNYRPRPPEPDKAARRIPLSDGLYAYVDAADYEWLSKYTWHMANGYAARREKNKTILMHCQIMKPPKGMMVDHANPNFPEEWPPERREEVHDQWLRAGRKKGRKARGKEGKKDTRGTKATANTKKAKVGRETQGARRKANRAR